MRILLIAGRFSRHPWSAAGTITTIAAALAHRGHTLHLLAHDMDDPEAFAHLGAVTTMRRFATGTSDWPLNYARFAARAARNIPCDASLSFSRVVRADLWLPLDPSAESWIRHTLDAHGRPGLLKRLVRHHGVLRAALVEALRRMPRSASHAPSPRILAIGPTSHGEAARLLAPTGLDQRLAQLPYFSTLPAHSNADLAPRRAAARALLNIPDARRVILCASTQYAGRTLAPVIKAIADLSRRDPRDPPMLLVLSKDAVAQHTRALRSGAIDHVKVLGPTSNIDRALAAADAVALPARAASGAFEAGASGRLAADALRLGRPLLAVSGAPGYDLCRLALPDGSRPGVVIEPSTPDAWARAIRQLLDPMGLESAQRAARAAGAPLSLTPFIDELERHLARAAAER